MIIKYETKRNKITKSGILKNSYYKKQDCNETGFLNRNFKKRGYKNHVIEPNPKQKHKEFIKFRSVKTIHSPSLLTSNDIHYKYKYINKVK